MRVWLEGSLDLFSAGGGSSGSREEEQRVQGFLDGGKRRHQVVGGRWEEGAVLLAQSGSQGLWERTAQGRAWRTGSAQGQGQRPAWRPCRQVAWVIEYCSGVESSSDSQGLRANLAELVVRPEGRSRGLSCKRQERRMHPKEPAEPGVGWSLHWGKHVPAAL